MGYLDNNNLYRFLSVPSEIAVLLVAALLIASLEFSLGGSPVRSDFAVLKNKDFY